MFPVNINELLLTFKLLERTNFSLDPDFFEPVGDDLFKTTTITAVGQANFRDGPLNRRLATLSGDSEPSDGHVLMRFEDMIEAGLATDGGNPVFILRKGDRIIQVASQVVNFEVIEVRPESPLDSVDSDALLIYIDFKHGPEDRIGTFQ